MKTIKVKLKNFFKSTIDYSFLFDSVKRANEIIFTCSHFIRSYLLNEYMNNNNLPQLNEPFIRMCFKVMCKKTKGPKNKNQLLFNKLEDYYLNSFYKNIKQANNKPNKNKFIDDFIKNNFSKNDKIKEIKKNIINCEKCDNNKIKECQKNLINYLNKYKFDSSNLSYILNEAAKEMVICNKNNIQMNFFKYICQFVNQSFKEDLNNKLNKCVNGKTKLRKQLKREYVKIKNDLIYDKLESDKKYHKWIKQFKDKILPSNYKKSYETDIKHYPYKYLKYMIFMNRYLENNELKMFQSICLRTELYDKFITINTNALIDILPFLENKNKYNNCIRTSKPFIWKSFFNLHKAQKLATNKYSFNYQMQTDGLSICLNFIEKNKMDKKNKEKDNKAIARKNSKEIYKGKTFEEIVKIKENNKEKQIEKKIKYSEKMKIKRKKDKDIFKKLSKEQQEKIKLNNKINNSEFNYIGDLIKYTSFLEDFKKAHNNKRLVYGDPGKKSILTLLGDNEKIFNYRTKRRIKEIKRNKYIKLIDNKKKKTQIGPFNEMTIKMAELMLSKFSGKTTKINEFNKYAKLKMLIRREIIKEKNYNEYIKKLKWFSHVNKKRHENKMLNELKTIYGKDAIMIIGDWGNKGHLSYISTPNAGTKRLLKRCFKTYHINEYKTSKLHHLTRKECDNLKIKLKKAKYKKKYKNELDGFSINENIKTLYSKLHSVLTYKMSNEKLGCINRDINAVKNMRNIVKHLITHKKRPIEFRRSKKINYSTPNI